MMYGLLNHRYCRLMRLDKMVGVYLALLPALWAVCLKAASVSQGLLYSVIILIGCVFARSAGCIINDYFDRDYDKLVARTKNRPIANGEVSLQEARVLIVITATIALIISLFLPSNALKVVMISIPFIIIYPLFKRFSFYPQLILGFTFNIGVFVGWYSVCDSLSYIAFVIYFSAVIWTIVYDSIYAFQDMEDDIQNGIKSLPIKLGDDAQKIFLQLYTVMVALMGIAGLGSNLNLCFYIILFIAGYYLYWQVETLDKSNVSNCAERFASNVDIGIIILVAICIGRL